jgi:hypothetical protein
VSAGKNNNRMSAFIAGRRQQRGVRMAMAADNPSLTEHAGETKRSGSVSR